MKKVELNLSESLYSRIFKISDLLDIELDDLISLCLIDGGYFRYWSIVEKILDDMLELLKDDDATDNIYEIKASLANQIYERINLTKDLDKLEQNFKKKYKNFDSDLEKHRHFLDFIDSLHEDLSKEEIEEEPPIVEKVATTSEFSQKEKKERKTKIEGEREGPPFRLIPKEYVPMLVLIAFVNLIVLNLLTLIWPNFKFPDILQYSPFHLIAYIIIIVLVSISTGFIYNYYYQKYRDKSPFREDRKQYREYVKEFDKLNPLIISKDPIIQVQNEIKRLRKLEKYLEIKTDKQEL